jgi:putative transposase
VSEYLAHYHEERPHQALGNRSPSGTDPPEEIGTLKLDEIVCHERLGGVLKHYERRAA